MKEAQEATSTLEHSPREMETLHMDKSSYNYNEGPQPLGGGSTSRVIRKRPQTNIKL